jgi:hypothetical protein
MRRRLGSLPTVRRHKDAIQETDMRNFSQYAAGAFAVAALGALGIFAWAQPPEDSPGEAPPPRARGDQGPPRPEGRRPPPPPKPPLETALDADADGEISAGEIENAPAVLKKLDKDGDGKLTPEEYRPPRPPADRGFDGRDFGRRRDGERDGNGPPPRREGRRRGPPEGRDPPPPPRGERDEEPRPPADE